MNSLDSQKLKQLSKTRDIFGKTLNLHRPNPMSEVGGCEEDWKRDAINSY